MIDHIKKKVQIRKINVQAHVLGWLLFIFYDAVIGGFVRGSFGSIGNYIIHYSINIALFYFHALVILPAAFSTRFHSIWKLPILLIVELAIYEFVIYYVDRLLLTYTNVLDINGLHFNKSFILAYIWRGLYFILFSTGYYLFRRYKTERDKNEALKQKQFDYELKQKSIEKEMAEARTAFLIAQVNPHFLFNTLNFIYYTTVKTAPEAANSILLLSQIMRYSSDIENAKDLVELPKEAEFVQWLMEIHRLRFGAKFHVSFVTEPQALEWKLIPFLLITVAENMFKHGITSDEHYLAKIHVGIDAQKNLLIYSQNKAKALKDPDGLRSGIKNLRERMTQQYGNLASLNYSQTPEGIFTLHISIPYQFKNG